jgi:hypothetical protein
MQNKGYSLLIFLLLAAFVAEAQSFYAIRRNRNLMLSAGSGIAYYQGDLVDPNEFGKIKPNFALGAEYFMFPRISVRANLTYYSLTGNDKTANDDRTERNLHFRSRNIEFAATGAVNLIPTGERFYQRARINLHAFAGIGVTYINPKAELDGEWHALQPLQTELKKYSRFQPVIPFGLGARIKVDPFFNVIIEGGYRKTFTDHLDDVSRTRYPDAALLKNDLARRLSDRRPEIGTQPTRPTEVGKRGNPDNDDGYFIGNISVQYYWPTEIFRSQRKLYNTKRRAIYRRR